MIRLVTFGIAAVALASPANAPRASAPYNGPVVVVVSIPVPQGLTRAKIEATFRKVAPAYEAIPELKQKYFTVNDQTHRAGGIYLWTNLAAAKAFYTDAWRAGVVQTFHAPAELTWFDAPLIIKGRAGMG